MDAELSTIKKPNPFRDFATLDNAITDWENAITAYVDVSYV